MDILKKSSLKYWASNLLALSLCIVWWQFGDFSYSDFSFVLGGYFMTSVPALIYYFITKAMNKRVDFTVFFVLQNLFIVINLLLIFEIY